MNSKWVRVRILMNKPQWEAVERRRAAASRPFAAALQPDPKFGECVCGGVGGGQVAAGVVYW